MFTAKVNVRLAIQVPMHWIAALIPIVFRR